MRRQEGEARDDAAGLLPRVIVYRRTPQNLPASLLEELSRLVRYGSSGKRGKYKATRLRRREAMLSGSPRSSRLDVVLGSVSHDPLWLARLFPERRHSRIHRTHRVTASPRAAIFPFLDSMPASSNESSNAFLRFNRTANHKCPFAGRNTAELRGRKPSVSPIKDFL